MKDERLEKQFEGYFENVKVPSNINEDAKRYVKKKSTFMPAFIKFASIAASIVLVLTASLVIVFNMRNAPPAVDSPNQAQVSTYQDSDLSFEKTDVYGISELDNSLKFIRTLAYNGADVKGCSAGYKDDGLAIVKADVSMMSGFSRYDAEIFVEFTDKNEVYSPLAAYGQGTKDSYKGVEYYLTRETAENGEPVNKLHFTYNGVKYYFYVTSSDENSYVKCLEMIIK